MIPPEMDETEPPWPDPDWEPLLEQAGVALETLEPVPPVWNPLIDVDRRAAWEGTYRGTDTAPLRIEAPHTAASRSSSGSYRPARSRLAWWGYSACP